MTLARATVMSVEEARSRARQALLEVADGQDPAGKRQVADRTFGALATEYMTRYARPNKRSCDEDQRILDKELLPYWRDRAVDKIDDAEIRRLVNRIAEVRKRPIMTNRTFSVISGVFNFAVREDWLP